MTWKDLALAPISILFFPCRRTALASSYIMSVPVTDSGMQPSVELTEQSDDDAYSTPGEVHISARGGPSPLFSNWKTTVLR